MTGEAWVFAAGFAVALVLLVMAQATNANLVKENRQLHRAARLGAEAPRETPSLSRRHGGPLPQQRRGGES